MGLVRPGAAALGVNRHVVKGLSLWLVYGDSSFLPISAVISPGTRGLQTCVIYDCHLMAGMEAVVQKLHYPPLGAEEVLAPCSPNLTDFGHNAPRCVCVFWCTRVGNTEV